MSMGMSTRSSRSSVAWEEAPDNSAVTSTPRNPHVGTSEGDSVPQVSSRGADPPQIVIGHVLQSGFHYKHIFPKDENFRSSRVPLSRDNSDITQPYLSTTGSHVISCGRCLSRNNSHSASNCHIVTYCSICNNWSNSYSNCKRAPINRS